MFIISIRWDPMGAKRYSSYKSHPEVIKLFLKFLPNGPHKTAFGSFEILKIEILMILFFVFANMGPNGSENFKTLLLQSATESFQTFPEFSSGPHKPTFGIFEILSLRFFTIFFRKFQIHHCSLWRNQKPQLSGERVIVEQNGVKFGTRGYLYNV